MPQIRTIPVGVSIPLEAKVMPYERAEEIVRGHRVFAVRNCVCRQERQALHKGLRSAHGDLPVLRLRGRADRS